MMVPPLLRYQIEAHEIHYGKGLDVRLSLAVALSTIQMTLRFARFHSNFEGEPPGGVQRPPTLFPFHKTHERTCSSTAI
ncbi:hypothetical protein TNCV_3854851 [Trichonephila clavipes]|nr:hypothetical protein TNCV_3854851 [Trichonephila clavipes]